MGGCLLNSCSSQIANKHYQVKNKISKRRTEAFKMAKNGLESRLKISSPYKEDIKDDKSEMNFINIFIIKSIVETRTAPGGSKSTEGMYRGEIKSSDDLDLTIKQFLDKYVVNIDSAKLDKENDDARASLLGILGQKEIQYNVAGGIPLRDQDLNTYHVWEAMMFNTNANANVLAISIKNTQGGGDHESSLYK